MEIVTLDWFSGRLQDATQGIGNDYFQLPVAGREEPIYRERCYCYELYHQLRNVWPENSGYKLCGEIDKSGHPIIRDNGLDDTKPDLLIHMPEAMEHNYAIIEVKPINGATKGVEKDVRTLLAYLKDGGYNRAIYLIYGRRNEGKALDKAIDVINQQSASQIEIWCHEEANTPANLIKL